MRSRSVRLLLFASGDFACNLYWQSTVLYLLFFYTDVLRLMPLVAGSIAVAAAIWDGVADLAAGWLAQRSRRGPAHLVRLGVLPLGVSFVALYAAPAGGGVATVAAAVVTQFLFRGCYAAVNDSYTAWTVDIAPTSRDRALVAGLRMTFGTIAALVVATLTQALAGHGSGSPVDASGYRLVALLFAVVASLVLLLMVWRLDRAVSHPPPPAPRRPIAATLSALLANRPFVTLNLAAAATTVAGTLLGRSVLYYCNDVLGDAAAGSRNLALMGVAGAVAVPAWMVVARRWGHHRTWLAAGLIGTALCLAFGIGHGRSPLATALFFVGMQVVATAFNFVFWAMLPDTVAADGERTEGLGFGLAALVQKAAGGAGSGLLGLAYQLSGYRQGVPVTAAIQAGIGWTMISGTGLFVALSLLPMAAARDKARHDR